MTRNPHDLQGQLFFLASKLGVDELRVLVRITERLEMGAKQYGALDIAKDKRDWTHEAFEEAADLSVYLAIGLLAAEFRERP